MFLAVYLFTFFGRSLVDSILRRIDLSQAVHHDSSTIDSGVTQHIRPKITLIYRQKDGQLLRILADEEDISAFARENINLLEQARAKLNSSVGKRIHDATNPVFAKMRGQITDYADWYFAWLTTYKILMEAITSATDHAMKTEAMSLKDAVAADIEKYLQKHFEDMVLQPEISDPQLKARFESTLQEVNNEFLLTISNMDQQFQKFSANKSTLLNPVDMANVKVDFDWDSQFKKVKIISHEKQVGGALVGVGLATGGAILGKSVGTALGKVTTGKVASTTMLKKLYKN